MNNIPLVCYNCGELNHTSKECVKAIYSYGIIVLKVTCREYNLLISSFNKPISELEKHIDSSELLMIQRNFSYCFLWFVKGIEIHNQTFHFLNPIWERMTENEQTILKSLHQIILKIYGN